METWGHGAFENDAGSDLVHDLKQARGIKLLRDAFAAVKTSGGDSDDCQTAIAAAEVVAAMKGAPARALVDEVKAWVKLQTQPPGEPLVAQARDTVRGILANSELKEIWDESGNAGPWKDQMKDLLARLTRA